VIAPRVHRSKPYELDDAARAFVAAHPDGGTLEEVAAAMGCSRRAIFACEQRALKKLERLR